MSACATQNDNDPVQQSKQTKQTEQLKQNTSGAICQPTPCPACPPCASRPAPPSELVVSWQAADWQALPDWQQDRVEDAWGAFMASCGAWQKALHSGAPAAIARTAAAWQNVCAAAQSLKQPSTQAVRDFFQKELQPYAVLADNGSPEGLITGYYEPLLRGSRQQGGAYQYALRGEPEQLLTIDLSSLQPDLAHRRLRGRLDGQRVVPYYSRAELAAKEQQGEQSATGKALFWVDDEVELFFLQIQGSGRIALADNRHIRVNYANQNGHPYRSIGRLLVERGELKLSEASMQGIQRWVRQHPEQGRQLLNENPSYVFFRERGEVAAHETNLGPLGALNVPLSAERSIAIDPRAVPLGIPVFLASNLDQQALNRLVMAQDTGGAIKGAVRADFFCGFGAHAGAKAGRMKQKGRLWVLWPKNQPTPK